MAAVKKPIARKDRVRQTLDEVRADLNKKFGDGTIVKGAEVKKRVLRKVTTGCLSYDMMLGGGWPTNKWNEVIGPPSSGKTSMLLKTIAANQALGKFSVLWVASEDFVEKWAELAGCDLNQFEFCETPVMEEAYETVIKYLDNRLVDCVVIDSFPALVPSGEEEAAMAEWQVGLGARLTGKFFRKSTTAQRRSLVAEDRDTLLLVVNQWRDKIGVLWGDPRTTPGGKAKDYFYFTRTEVKRDEWIPKEKTEVRRGISIAAHTIKNKVAPVERSAGVDFYFDGPMAGQYDEGKDYFACGTYTEVIEKNGSMYTFGEYKWRGRDEAIAALREDVELRALVRYEVMRSIGVDEPLPKRYQKKPAPAKPPSTVKKVASTTKAAAPAAPKKMMKRAS